MGGGYQNRASGKNGGGRSKFWSFCENVIMRMPLYEEHLNFSKAEI